MTKPSLRCAIYTRVSSDQGLEQDFNSLDAQREAAEAYIKSQAHEGWRLIRDRFDDGGFSGGSMERPALQELLNRVREERVEIIVVYKVDRLTRSLADFAKLVELFDVHKVSFVSVTQSFNTTSSMGRLTLNVLLSFAQFEREVTGERIRDKIAASKKKGIWMGGVVPFEDRKLLIEESEAAIVRQIFDLYLAHGSLPAVQRELNARQIVSRPRAYATGRSVGGVPFSNGALSHMLRNRHYIADLNHRGKSWPGEHQPIIDVGIFGAVQEKLAAQKQRRSRHVLSTESLLIGKIYLESGERMSPNYAMKKGVRYRYYIARSILQGQRGVPRTLGRLPAEPLEQAVIASLRGALEQRNHQSAISDAELIDAHIDRVVVQPNSLVVTLKVEANVDEPATRLTIPWVKPETIRRREIILPKASAIRMQPIRVNEQSRLVRAIAISRRWVDEIIAGAVSDTAALAKREGKTERSIRMALSLAFLDPALIKAACEGRLPRGYGVSRLMDLPSDFSEQWRALGLPRPA